MLPATRGKTSQEAEIDYGAGLSNDESDLIETRLSRRRAWDTEHETTPGQIVETGRMNEVILYDLARQQLGFKLPGRRSDGASTERALA
jgi:hypothetical protein